MKKTDKQDNTPEKLSEQLQSIMTRIHAMEIRSDQQDKRINKMETNINKKLDLLLEYQTKPNNQ